jgi:ABC-type nitrate/sulfonate/bicarbonate transport system substrate-binding protein
MGRGVSTAALAVGLGLALLAGACAAPAASRAPAERPAAPRSDSGASGAVSASSRAGDGPGAGTARESLSVGLLPPSAFSWATWAALARGFFAAQALDVEFVQFGAPNDAARAAVSGSVPIAHFSVDAAVRAIEGGGDLAVIGAEIANPAFSLIVQPELRDYADLRGKALAVSTPKDGAAVVLRLMLRAQGLADDDYDFVAVGTTPNRFAALRSRAADGAIMVQPVDFAAIDEGYRLLGRSTTVLPEFMFMSIAANRTWATEHRAVAVRYLRALGAAIDWLYDPTNREEAIDLLATRTNTDRAAVARTYAVYFQEGSVVPRNAEVPVAGLEAYLQAMVELGDLPGPRAEVARYGDPSFGQAARR